MAGLIFEFFASLYFLILKSKYLLNPHLPLYYDDLLCDIPNFLVCTTEMEIELEDT